MNWMSPKQQQEAVKFLRANGWTWTNDQMHPHFDYAANLYGWWVHPVHRPRPTGDSRKFYRAAEIAFTDIGHYEMTELAEAS